MRKQQYSPNDFTESQLPHNRKEVFLDCLNVRYPTFIRCGILLLIFSLPLLAVFLLRDLYVFSLDYSLPQEELHKELVSINNLTGIMAVPSWVLFGLGLSGVIRLIRQLVWSNPIFFRKDFVYGIQSNGKIYAMTFLLLGILFLFANYVSNLLIQPEYLRLLPWVFIVVGFLPVAWLMLSQTAVYTTKFFGCMKDSFLLFVQTVLPTFAISLSLLVPVIALLISNIIMKYLFLALYIIFLLPLGVMIWFLYSCYIFDKYINAKQFPELVDKGIWKINR